MGKRRLPGPGPGRSGPRHRMQTDTGWFPYWAQRLKDAHCHDRPDLPWVSNEEPQPAYKSAMRDVCLSCPVRIACADYALDRDVPALGGYYATVWIPWRSFSRPDEGWHSARRLLRRRWSGWMEQEFRALQERSGKESADAYIAPTG